VSDRGHDHVVDDDGVLGDAEHLRDREAVDVGVEDGDVMALLGQRDRRVHRDRRLAHAALARGDAEDAGLGAGRHERVGAALLVAQPLSLPVVVAVVGVAAACRRSHPLPYGVALLVGHHRHVDLHVVHAVEGQQGGGDPVGDLGPQRAAGHGEGHEHADGAAPDLDALHHAEVDDGHVQLGVLDGAKRLDDLRLGDCHVWCPSDFHYADR
jgi:hypothetical protein